MAEIELVFNFGKLIELLKERGALISQCKWNKVNECNEKIDKYLKEGGKQEICEVVSAFITFQREDGYDEALEIGASTSHLKDY